MLGAVLAAAMLAGPSAGGAEADPPPCTLAPFEDVLSSDAFCAEIQWLVGEGVTTGYVDGTFRPAAPVSRQSMAAFLARLAGAVPEDCESAPFEDVLPSQAFCAEIQWLVGEGVTTGYGDGTFRPNAPVSRQSMAAFMSRLTKVTPAVCASAPFLDVAASHDFCAEITWLADTGVSEGYPVPGGFEYRPAVPVSRQAMAAFLHRLDAGPLFGCPSPFGALPKTECRALVALYKFNGGDAWTDATTWMSASDPCTWYGVTCAGDHVTELDLAGNNLTGGLNDHIGDLTGLVKLYAVTNHLTALPPGIGELANLDVLRVGSNELSGLPAELANLTGLTDLALRDNDLQGFPEVVLDLVGLQTLSVGANDLGTVPAGIDQLADLVSLDLEDSQLTDVPAELGALAALKVLDLEGNDLVSVPAELGDLGSLTDLHLGNNQLTSVPDELAELTNLTDLELHMNQLTSLPASIGDLAELEYLSLYLNQLTSLPASIGDLAELETLYADSNQLVSVPATIGDLGKLETLYLNSNQLTSLPAELGNLTALTKLKLDINLLTGDISSWAKPLSLAPTPFTTLKLSDGPGKNDCLTDGGDSTLGAWLTGLDPTWDECGP